MKATEQRLFTPRTGAAPPALTGRDREQAVLGQCLADLLDGGAPPHDVALMGPRGNGKTVLLNWLGVGLKLTNQASGGTTIHRVDLIGDRDFGSIGCRE